MTGPQRAPEPRSGGTTATGSSGRGHAAPAIAVIGLVLSLAGWGWFASEQARAGWWTFGQHVAVEPDDRGWAESDSLSVRLAGVETALEVDEEQAPTGFQFLVLDFQVRVEGSAQSSTCDVQVRDEQGRLFQAGREVPSADPHVSSLTCGTSDPGDDPVPPGQSMLVLVPVDAELISVRVDAPELPPASFIELPLPS